MKLVIFDIDGTLTLTNHADELCFLRTAQMLINSKIQEIVPEQFIHYTDQNIVRELYLWNQGKEVQETEIETFKSMIKLHLNEMKVDKPEFFKAVSGAQNILKIFNSDWKVALATGCWEFAAKIKLEAAAIDLPDNLPISTSDGILSRQEIMLNAIKKAKLNYDITDFERIVYIGDGIWDLKTCASLNIPFVGIEAEEKMTKRQALGHFWKLENYLDRDNFLHCLENAEIPKM
jgi:phosphoglycolate phosphatase-like HAD superfamily hydrolase